MAIVHDIGEAIVGDICPGDNISNEDKHAAESAAIKHIQKMLGESTPAAMELSELWCAPVLLFQPKYRLIHPENYSFSLSKKIFSRSKYL